MDNDELKKRLIALKAKFAAFNKKYNFHLDNFTKPSRMTERRRSKRLNALAMRRRRSP